MSNVAHWGLLSQEWATASTPPQIWLVQQAITHIWRFDRAWWTVLVLERISCLPGKQVKLMQCGRRPRQYHQVVTSEICHLAYYAILFSAPSFYCLELTLCHPMASDHHIYDVCTSYWQCQCALPAWQHAGGMP